MVVTHTRLQTRQYMNVGNLIWDVMPTFHVGLPEDLKLEDSLSLRIVNLSGIQSDFNCVLIKTRHMVKTTMKKWCIGCHLLPHEEPSFVTTSFIQLWRAVPTNSQKTQK